MLNLIKKKIALIWAKKHVTEAFTFKKNAVEDQEKLLLSLVKTAEKTLFGREHQFENIHAISDFQNKVQISHDFSAPCACKLTSQFSKQLFPLLLQ